MSYPRMAIGDPLYYLAYNPNFLLATSFTFSVNSMDAGGDDTILHRRYIRNLHSIRWHAAQPRSIALSHFGFSHCD